MKVLPFLPLLLLAVPVDAAQQPHITSVYTTLDLNQCKLLKGDFRYFLHDGSWRCDGLAGTPLTVIETAGRYDVYPGSGRNSKIKSTFWEAPPSKMVEWRLSNGKPFAIIYQLNLKDVSLGPDPKVAKLLYSRLIVSTIATQQKPACRIAEIDKVDAKAHAAARAAADKLLTGQAKCIFIPLDYAPQLNATEAAAKGRQLSSAYTPVDRGHCQPVKSDPDETRRIWSCGRHGSYALFVQKGDGGFDVSAGDPATNDSGPNYGYEVDGAEFPHTSVEWRLARGKPYAIIYRLGVRTKRESALKSRLIVEDIGDASTGWGCRIAEIGGDTPTANIKARAEADKILTDNVTCLEEDRYGD